MDKFRKEWNNFTLRFDKISDLINKVRDAFNEVSTTRKDKLDSILYDIDMLTKSVGIIEYEYEIQSED